GGLRTEARARRRRLQKGGAGFRERPNVPARVLATHGKTDEKAAARHARPIRSGAHTASRCFTATCFSGRRFSLPMDDGGWGAAHLPANFAARLADEARARAAVGR